MTFWKMWLMAGLTIFYCFFYTGFTQSSGGSSAGGSSSTSNSFSDENCWINKSKPIDAAKNYMDCTVEKYVQQNLIKCCKVGDSVGCCPAAATQNFRMLKIAMGILGVSLALGLLLTACLYCDKKTCPCLEKVEYQIEECESSCWCCQNRVETRRLERKLLQRQQMASERYRSVNTNEVNSDRRTIPDESVNDVSLPAPPEFKQKSYGEEWF